MTDGRQQHNDTLTAKRHARIEDAQYLRDMGEHPECADPGRTAVVTSKDHQTAPRRSAAA